MTSHTGFIQYFFQASPVVKIVLYLLLLASIASWTFIIQRHFFYKKLKKIVEQFEDKIWHVQDLAGFYQEIKNNLSFIAGLEYIFINGFKEFVNTRKIAPNDRLFVIENTERAMKVAEAKELSKLEKHLSFLASIGSVSPYVGLFGTVWGIMMAFHSLSGAEQVTIAMVAPGIAEALIATAIGLFAAIPAVLAYNFYSNKVSQFADIFDQFQERFSLLLHQALYAELNKSERNNHHDSYGQEPA